MKAIRDYAHYLFRYRYFWAYLARCDLIARFRRSKLGMLWIMLSPLLLTIIMAVVFGTVFRQNILDYAPYILSGMITWEFISTSVVGNGMAFISCEAYIRQVNHPVSIYTLKATVVAIVNFMIAMIGLAIWSLFIHPMNTLMGIMTLPLTVVLLFFTGWAASTVAAYTNAKFRDYPQIMLLAMQVLWYFSPVFFQESMFTGNIILNAVFHYNPITHILYLVRKPFLYGRMPNVVDYGYTLLLLVLCALLAYQVNKRNEKDIIFYL